MKQIRPDQVPPQRDSAMGRYAVLAILGLVLFPAALHAEEIGEAMYLEHCAVCHQPDGKGIPGFFPPLAGNPSVTANGRSDVLQYLARIIFGFHGSLIVNGQLYTGRMPPIGYRGHINDSELLALINYQRSAWGNHGRLITPSELAEARAAGKP